MDYADGGDVHQAVKDRGGRLLPEAQALCWFAQAANALNYVHKQKILHRDLKTQNIFLTRTGMVKLGDFGIARVLEATKDFARTMVGTPYYLSPEMIEEKPYNFASDVWSLGVCLYEMTTLKHPFDADSLHYLAIKIIQCKYPPPDPTLYSPGLVDLISRMLSKDAASRPTVLDILQQDCVYVALEEACSQFGMENPVELPTPSYLASTAPARLDCGDNPKPAGKVRPSTAAMTRPGDGSADSTCAGDASDVLDDGVSVLSEEGGQVDHQELVLPSPSKSVANCGPVAKAAQLRSYLLGQVPPDKFEKAYNIVRESAGSLVEQLEVVLEDKAVTEQLQPLFQLLVFMDDFSGGST